MRDAFDGDAAFKREGESHSIPFPSARGARDLIRRAVSYGLCAVLAAAGIGTSVIVFGLAKGVEDARIRGALEVRSEWRAADIEHRLSDGLMPLGVLASFLSEHLDATEKELADWTARTASFGMPLSRLGWEPLVRHADRAQFEQAVRDAGRPGFQISELGPGERELVRAADREIYFPVRYERLRPGFVSVLGFDLASDEIRREALEQARDRAQPVAFRPARRLAAHQHEMTYVVYWPVFRGGGDLASVEGRREALAGYVTALILLSEALDDALREPAEVDETLIFRVANIGFGDEEEIIATHVAGQGLTIAGRAPATSPGDVVFQKTFSALQQRWTLEFRFTEALIQPMRTREPWIAMLLGLAVTTMIVSGLLIIVRLSEADRIRHRGTVSLMRQLEEAYAALATANAQLGERERAATETAHARTRFLASASHDLRQPLHALALFTSALQRRVSDPKGIELVEHIGNVTMSMQHMFTSLLDLSRLDAEAVAANVRPCELDPLLSRLVAEFAVLTDGKRLRLRRSGRLARVSTDPDLLQAILRNLIGNAVKFTDTGGVLIATRPTRQDLRIEIWDTGRGIPAAHLDRIFEEFERLETGARTPGFGLGLPIVRQLCRLVGARVEVCSRSGQGSRFSVVLPRTDEPVELPVEPLDQNVFPEWLRILIVDNDDDVQRALSLELEDLGFIVQAAGDGEEAMRIVRAGLAPDLVLLDLELGAGKKSGWVVAKELRALRPDLRIILVTGSTDARTLERIRYSDLPTLFKPVRPDALRRLIASQTPVEEIPSS